MSKEREEFLELRDKVEKHLDEEGKKESINVNSIYDNYLVYVEKICEMMVTNDQLLTTLVEEVSGLKHVLALTLNSVERKASGVHIEEPRGEGPLKPIDLDTKQEVMFGDSLPKRVFRGNQYTKKKIEDGEDVKRNMPKV